MRIKQGFVIQKVVDDYIAVPVGDASEKLHGIIKLNDTGYFLWNLLSENNQTIDALISALIDEYSINSETAITDINLFLSQLRNIGCIEE